MVTKPLLDKWFFVNRDEDGLMSWETLNQGLLWYPNLHQYSSWVDHDHIGLVTTLEKTFDNSKVFLGIDNQMYWSHVTAFVNNGFGEVEHLIIMILVERVLHYLRVEHYGIIMLKNHLQIYLFVDYITLVSLV